MKSKKSIFALALCGILAVCASVIGATAAWFTDTVTASGSVTTGSVTATLKVNGASYTGTSNTDKTFNSNVMPGGALVSNVKVSINTQDISSRGAYARIKVTITGVTGETYTGLSGWTKDLTGFESGYYYYTGAGSSMAAITSTADVTFCTAINLPTSYTSQNANVSVTIVLEAIQAANNADVESWEA